MTPGGGDVGPPIEAVRAYLGRRGLSAGPVEVGLALRDLGHLVSDQAVRATVAALRRESVGAGPLEELLTLPGVTDVLVNGPARVFVDRGHGLEQVPSPFADESDVRRLAVRLAATVGRRLDEGSPFVDARLASGVRVHAVLGAVADQGTCLSLRVPRSTTLSLEDWVAGGALAPAAARVLRRMVARRCAFLVSGGTGSGKTTLLASLLSLVPPDERIVIAEDSRELNPAHPHCLRLEGRPANVEGAGAVTLTDLVRQALRMRPDRLVVGEVRGPELVDLLTALNTGHEGGCGTLHANSAGDVPARLEALAALGGLGRTALHAQVAAALDLVVQIRRFPDGRRWVEEIRVIQADPASGVCRAVPALRFDVNGTVTRLEAAEALLRLVSR
ncbi:MAG: TadA family conjugal transfer-associated ATPase [Propionibacteriaceae bacterium]|nr:TadA family conjugal transfer-associated ATPase [Propionibacteriaceae bacterium]